MGVLNKGTDFSNGDQVTDTNLDNLVDNATFTSSAVDDVSTAVGGTGAIIVKDGGITTGKLADSTGASDGVTTAKIATGAVTTAKLADSAVTSVKIATDAVTSSEIAAGAVTSSEIAASAVTSSELAANAVTTAKITDGNVTKAKIEDVANMKVLGNTSGSAAAPQEVSILDEDDMSSDSATAIATQQSTKAYVDSKAVSSNIILATKSSQFTGGDVTISGYTLSGTGVSESSGVLTITGAGVWAVSVYSTCNLSGTTGHEWRNDFYVDGSIRFEGDITNNEDAAQNLSGFTFINSSGSFTVEVRANELSGTSSCYIENTRIEAIKLS